MVENFLDESCSQFDSGNGMKAMRTICEGLRAVRFGVSAERWREYINIARAHKSLATAYSCPFTTHAASRPFGYPGDATLIDYIYGYKKPSLSGAASKIFGFTTNSPAARAVRFRRSILAHLIDKILHARGEEAEILSVACGHLRELELSQGILRIRPANFIALDQDEKSLAEVSKSYGALGVTTQRGSVKDLISGSAAYSSMNLIYAAGLFDYLNDSAATKLTKNLFGMLSSGGTLMIANFLPNIADIGYMEAVMDWWLLYRDEAAMLSLISGIPPEEIQNIKQYRDPDENITFLELTRK